MKHKQSILLSFLLMIAVLSAVTITADAHAGRTDSNGGHYDHSTGEYHYHHGYPAHDHYDMNGDGIMDCPYDFDDKTGENSGSSSKNSNSSKGSSGTYTERNTSTSSNTSQSKEATSKNTKSKRLSFINMTETLFLIIIAILLGGPVVFAFYALVISIVSIPCSWLWKLFRRNLNEDKNQTYATITANVIVCVLLYVFFLFPVVEALIDNPNVLAAILIAAGILVFIGLLIYSKQVNRTEELNRSVHSMEREITSLKAETEALDSSKIALEKRANYWESMYKSKTERIAELEEANHTLWATIDKLRSPISPADGSRKTSDNEKAINIPDDIYFINGGIPVKGKIRDRTPYGDFTIYVANRGKCFHKDPYCGSGLMDAKHIYEVLGKKSPCQRCAYACRETVPDWYIQIKKAVSKSPEQKTETSSFASNTSIFPGRLHLSYDCNKVSDEYIEKAARSLGISLTTALAIMNSERKKKGLPPLNNTFE